MSFIEKHKEILIGAGISLITIPTILLIIRQLQKRSKVRLVGRKAPITSPFGYRTDPVTKQQGTFHNGIDIGVPIGTPVFSPADGVVAGAWVDGSCGVGLRINHGLYITGYCHLSKQLVKIGQKVRKGDMIALTGNTGKSTGPHLHFVVFDNRLAKYIDPQKTKIIDLT